jgi:hypothetical protein
MKNNSAAIRAPLPTRVIDPLRHAALIAAIARSQDLLQQLLNVAIFEAADPQLGGLRATVEAHLRSVRQKLNSAPTIHNHNTNEGTPCT